MFFLKYLPTQSLIQNYSDHFQKGAEPQVAEKLEMLREASLLLRNLDDFFREHDFSLTRFLICVTLDRSERQGGLHHADIVARIDVSPPVISRSLKSLTDEKLVQVTPDPTSSRGKLLILSPSGRERLTALMPGYFDILLRS